LRYVYAVEHETYYATVAQVLPVLMLVLILELRLSKRGESETIGESLWLVGVFGALLVGELTCLLTLQSGEAPSRIVNVMIVLAWFYGLTMLCVIPIATRLRAIRDALPRKLVFVVENGAIFGMIAITLLAEFNVVRTSILATVIATVVLLTVLVGRAVTVFGR
jgi:hypothetical protein